MVSLVNRHEGLVGVVFLVCLARVVFAGGVDRPRDVFATGAFADDDENVVDLTLVVRWAEFLDRVDDEGVRVVGVQRNHGRYLVFVAPNMVLLHRAFPKLRVVDGACNARK
jgi:hypothetical protein